MTTEQHDIEDRKHDDAHRYTAGISSLDLAHSIMLSMRPAELLANKATHNTLSVSSLGVAEHAIA